MNLSDDPVFDAFIDDCIERTGVPPDIGDIMFFIEARASVELDRDGTRRA